MLALMLAQRRSQRVNIKATFGQRSLLARFIQYYVLICFTK